ncbi:hypothetical protein F2Q69_00036220 [Brassica cretica]|uniref:Uncharacterized protein n=1 Tax=Brassica cretica TaxID=69181 RepID=A0A8S9SJ90_BRACR|nr:hypothetical protein F2Q69_00036220 [Brassica cretica]
MISGSKGKSQGSHMTTGSNYDSKNLRVPIWPRCSKSDLRSKEESTGSHIAYGFQICYQDRKENFQVPLQPPGPKPEKELAQAGSEFPSSSAQVVASCHGTEVMALLPQALPAGSSTTPILVEDKEKAADSMPPPPARKDVVLALRGPSSVLATQPKSRKRKLAKSGNGENSQRGGSSLASGLRGKFISLIDWMIGECGSETSRLSGELVELQGRWSGTEAMLTAVKDSHSAKVSKLEVAIGELERDLGKRASSLLKEKKAKSSEVHRLQSQIESDAGLARRGIQEATDALRAEFQARLAKISASLGSLECIQSRDLALATIEGGMAVVWSFQSETPPTLEAEES